MKMASIPTENKRFTARYDADPIFMRGGAPTAHEVLSECGFLASEGTRHIRITTASSTGRCNTRRSRLGQLFRQCRHRRCAGGTRWQRENEHGVARLWLANLWSQLRRNQREPTSAASSRRHSYVLLSSR